MKVINEKYASLSEVKKILEDKEKKYSKEGKELLYEQRRALEHSQRHAKLKIKDVRELEKKLGELDMNLTEEQIIKMCDLLPETVDDVRAIFAKERFRYNEGEIKKILDIIAQYR
ncbi:MAG: RNA polymerase Rpb4 family protein [Candidatus Altiarchaeales archaeon]|nr:MAG: RNA polymerase Rpb4 family protein [Candidatus Altiarchaeales archaeon]